MNRRETLVAMIVAPFAAALARIRGRRWWVCENIAIHFGEMPEPRDGDAWTSLKSTTSIEIVGATRVDAKPQRDASGFRQYIWQDRNGSRGMVAEGRRDDETGHPWSVTGCVDKFDNVDGWPTA